jgi:hypothetical protein
LAGDRFVQISRRSKGEKTTTGALTAQARAFALKLPAKYGFFSAESGLFFSPARQTAYFPKKPPQPDYGLRTGLPPSMGMATTGALTTQVRAFALKLPAKYGLFSSRFRAFSAIISSQVRAFVQPGSATAHFRNKCPFAGHGLRLDLPAQVRGEATTGALTTKSGPSVSELSAKLGLGNCFFRASSGHFQPSLPPKYGLFVEKLPPRYGLFSQLSIKYRPLVLKLPAKSSGLEAAFQLVSGQHKSLFALMRANAAIHNFLIALFAAGFAGGRASSETRFVPQKEKSSKTSGAI